MLKLAHLLYMLLQIIVKQVIMYQMDNVIHVLLELQLVIQQLYKIVLMVIIKLEHHVLNVQIMLLPAIQVELF